MKKLLLLTACLLLLTGCGEPQIQSGLSAQEEKDKGCASVVGDHMYWNGNKCACKESDGYISSPDSGGTKCITFETYCTTYFDKNSRSTGQVNNTTDINVIMRRELVKCECINGYVPSGSFLEGPKCVTQSTLNGCKSKPNNSVCDFSTTKGWKCNDNYVEGKLPGDNNIKCLTISQCMATCPTGTSFDGTIYKEGRCECTPYNYNR